MVWKSAIILRRQHFLNSDSDLDKSNVILALKVSYKCCQIFLVKKLFPRILYNTGLRVYLHFSKLFIYAIDLSHWNTYTHSTLTYLNITFYQVYYPNLCVKFTDCFRWHCALLKMTRGWKKSKSKKVIMQQGLPNRHTTLKQLS